MLVASESANATHAGELKSDEEIVFFPTFAPIAAVNDPRSKRPLDLPIHGWVFEPLGPGPKREVACATLSNLLGLDDAERKAPLFYRRIERFVVDNERGKSPLIRVLDTHVPLADSTADGHTESLITIPVEQNSFADRAVLEFRLQTRSHDRREFKGRVQLIGPTGLSVVSDGCNSPSARWKA